MSASLRAGNSSDGYLQIDGADIVDITASGMAPSSGKTITANQFSSAPSFRNKIIGGDFTTNPWQRGTGALSITTDGSENFLADRFIAQKSSAAVFSYVKTTDAPSASEVGVFTQHCLHIDITTADASIAAGDYAAVQHKIEGLNAASFGFGQSGTRYVTLSFWHKHTKTGTYCVGFLNSAANRSYVAEYTQDVTDTWEKATITIPVDTSGTWLYDTGVGLRMYFALAAGSTFQTTANTWAAGSYFATSNQVNALDSTSNNFKIALVQLEAGSVATPFESRPYGTELALCQRYYEKSFLIGTAPAQNVATGAYLFPQPIGATSQVYAPAIKFAVVKRVSPTTIVSYNPYAANSQIRNTTISADWSGTSFTASDSVLYPLGTTPAASAVGNTSQVHWTVDSEL